MEEIEMEDYIIEYFMQRLGFNIVYIRYGKNYEGFYDGTNRIK